MLLAAVQMLLLYSILQLAFGAAVTAAAVTAAAVDGAALADAAAAAGVPSA